MPVKPSPAFQQWFGASQVVDADGAPLVVYHGTFAVFSAFDIAFSDDFGFHFGSAAAANARNDYWMKGRTDEAQPNIMPVYLSIKNPKYLSYDPYDEVEWAAQIVIASDEGHDGISYTNRVEDKGHTSWVAFKPAQIKSALSNNGDFDTVNTDIRFSLADLEEPSSQEAPCP